MLLLCLCDGVIASDVKARERKNGWRTASLSIMPHEPLNVNNGVQRLSNDAYGIRLFGAYGLHEASYKCAYNNSCFSFFWNKTIVCNTTIMITTATIATTATTTTIAKEKHMILPKLRHKNLKALNALICIWHERILKTETERKEFNFVRDQKGKREERIVHCFYYAMFLFM